MGPQRPLVLISSLVVGGAERVTVSFLARAARQGRPAAVATVYSRRDPALAAELSAAGVPCRDLGARRLADPAALLRLLVLLRRGRVDLVHAHGQDASILAALARWLHRAPLVITRHVLEEPAGDGRQRLRARLAFAAARRADAVVAVSEAVAGWLGPRARLRPERTRVILNGVDLGLFRAPNQAAARVRADLGIGGDGALVLVPAALREGKGHSLLLAALPAVRALYPGVCLAFAGCGEREGALREQAAPHGRAVRFLGLRSDVPDLLAACDLVALPSFAEALPMALIEAAAAGRAVVATRVGGVPEVVEDGRTGRLVAPGDVPALADALSSLLGDLASRTALGRAARRLAEERFSLDVQVRRTLELWSEMGATP